mgnify:CR=1 FL=1
MARPAGARARAATKGRYHSLVEYGPSGANIITMPRPFRSCSRSVVGALLVCAAGAGGIVHAAPTVLAPQFAGVFGPGTGAAADFRQVPGDWRGSTVLWDESSASYGTGAPIGSFSWGTGLWGRADWQTWQDPARSGDLVGAWTGPVSDINFGNAVYNRLWSAEWGPTTLVPLFGAGTPEGAQENWIARFTGYVRVSDPGWYDLSVLNDDGFFFSLLGAGGASVEIGRDFLNPRERNGFDEGLWLSTGLYGFELGMWNRLEAGVVDLRWRRSGGDTPWELVPTTARLPPSAVPVPATLALALLGLGLTAALRRSAPATA